MKNVVIFIRTVELIAAASAADAGIYKKILGSGNNTTLIILNN